MNNLLKLSINRHPRRLPEPVDRLYSVVQLQIKDLQRALYSHGNSTLAPEFAAFTVPHAVWQSKSQEEKHEHCASSWLTQ